MIQRRYQKVVERAPAPYLDEATRARLCEAALKIGRATGYVGADTGEFLMGAGTGEFYFIEAAPTGAQWASASAWMGARRIPARW